MSPSKKGSAVVILLIVILIIVLSGVIYLQISKKNEPQQSSQEQSTNVKYYTYTNSKGKYSLQLPEGWGVVDEDVQGKIFGFKAYPSDQKQLKWQDEINLQKNSDKQIFFSSTHVSDQNKLKQNFDIITKTSSNYDLPSRATIVQEIKVGDDNSKKDGDLYYRGFTFRTNNVVYNITLGYKNPQDLSILMSYANKMLETFTEIQ